MECLKVNERITLATGEVEIVDARVGGILKGVSVHWDVRGKLECNCY